MRWGLLLLALFISSCEEIQEGENAQWVQGLNIDNEVSSCLKASPEQICTDVFTEQDQFARDCEDQGNTAVACSCHEYLCVSSGSGSVKPLVGYTSNGKASSCLPMPSDHICSTEYTEEDAFADRCAEAGHEVFQCGCHSYLCSKKM